MSVIFFIVHLQPLCNPYVTLGHTYSSGKQDALEPVVSKFNEIFTNVT